ncbi:MAG: hypothetical protein MUO24_02160 [Desulfobacterales bacterium]|nr:hypothetical protein [Desulfobacterales bacterium]
MRRAIGLTCEKFRGLGGETTGRAFHVMIAKNYRVRMPLESSEFKIFDSVIILDPILMMNNFSSFQRAPKMLSHDKAMLTNHEVMT